MELINKTGQTQQLNLIDKALKVKAGASVKIEICEIYDHELERSKRFFKIKKDKKIKKELVKFKAEKEIIEGGK